MEATNSFVKSVRPVFPLCVAAILCYGALYLPQPFIPNLLLDRLCEGGKECSASIYLIGALQLGIGIGAVVFAPILGGLSDKYGRKPILLLFFVTAIFPQVVLVVFKNKTGVYIWFPLSLIAFTCREGGLIPTLLASVADVVAENGRPAINGLTIGSLSVGYIGGILASLALKTVDQALWASAILQVCATIYVAVFFKETNPTEPVLPANLSQSESAEKLLPKLEQKRGLSTNFRETARTVWSSRRLLTIIVVDFLNSYGLAGLYVFTAFYLVAVFGYGEKQIAVIILLGAGGSALGMTVVYPQLSRLLGERVLLVSLLASAGHYFIYGFARTSWLPYIAAAMELFFSVTTPALGTMVSRGVDRGQQGNIQGFMAANRSAAAILAPLTITPLAALSLGGNPPFGLPGLPFILCGFGMVLAWFVSIGLPPLPPPVHSEEPSEHI